MLSRITLLVLLAFALTANGQNTAVGQLSAATQPHITTVFDGDSGRTICLSTGEILEIRLKAQFGTGYRWELAVKNKRLKLVGQTVVTTSTGQESSPEIQVFRFEARSAGSFFLRLDHVRPWEKGVDPTKTFSLRGKVSKRTAK